MNSDIITYLDKVREMRDCQKKYFAARKGHDHQTATAYLDKCKRLEPEVDALTEQLSEKLKHGEQQSLF